MENIKFFLSKFFSKKELETLKVSTHNHECQFCFSKLTCSSLDPCFHQICVNCLDAVYDSGIFLCPLCYKEIDDFDYLIDN